MHWSTTTAEECVSRGDKKVVIETGTSISGIPHLGNASDIIRGECVRKAVERSGYPAELVWVADDSDPFRSVPKGMESLKEYLGYPVKDIPDPDGCHDNFVEHFAKPFLESLKSFGVKPKVYSGTEIYRSGQLLEEIRIVIERRAEIISILNEFRDTPLDADWIPWTPICEKCGKISSTRATAVDGDKVSYVCEGSEVKGGEVAGCGHQGVSDIKDGMGKMPWRVEWASRWNHFKVTCEPFGKDHASAGGSYWTSKKIIENIFGRDAPVPVIYEFLTLNGEKISSSKGNVITPAGWLEIAEPEVLNYFMYKKLNKQRDIDLSRIPPMADEYDQAEAQYFSSAGSDESLQYLLSQVGEPKKLNVPYTFCAVLAQVVPELDDSVIVERANFSGYCDFDAERLVERVRVAGNWVRQYGPEQLTFTLNTVDGARKEFSKLTDVEKKCLRELSKQLDKPQTAEEFHKTIYNTARANDLKPPQLFKAIYTTLIGKEKGPKAAALLLTLDRNHVRECFK